MVQKAEADATLRNYRYFIHDDFPFENHYTDYNVKKRFPVMKSKFY
ncbi:hypothetical protein [Peribacillus frigoritolerans]|nr:hypothetical protein [Peribacillus frigoritolerans]MCM3167477.1 hypothetical protein [Peribacillus frigoritolerans]